MARKVLVSLTVLVVAALSGYTGWYLGHIEGFAKAKGQYDSTARNRPSENIQIPQKNTKPQLNSTQLAQQQVAKMNRVIKQTAKLNQQNKRKNYSIAKVEEKSASCRWIVGRLGELRQIVNSGGRGSQSGFCDEHKKRLLELHEENCISKPFQFGGVC